MTTEFFAAIAALPSMVPPLPVLFATTASNPPSTFPKASNERAPCTSAEIATDG